MGMHILVGIGGGLASGLLFAAPGFGVAIIIPFLFLTQLPIAIASLGWGSISGLIAATAGTLLVGLTLGLPGAASFIMFIAAPAAWLSHLVGLARPGDPIANTPTQWFPLGRVLMHAGILVIIATIALSVVFGINEEILAKRVTEAFGEIFNTGTQSGAIQPDPQAIATYTKTFVWLIPIVFPVTWLLIAVGNLYLAARIVRMSGRLTRPWEKLANISLPEPVAIVFCISLAAMFLNGATALAAAVVAGALGFLFLLVGLAVMHTVTVGSQMRLFILWVVYILLVMTPFSAALIAALGLAEGFFNLRARIGKTPGAST